MMMKKIDDEKIEHAFFVGLPESLQPLGNQYAKDEFRRHKTCTTHEATLFMNEWTVTQKNQYKRKTSV